MVWRILIGAVAIAPFVLLAVAMLTRRAHVKACCAGTLSGNASVGTSATRPDMQSQRSQDQPPSRAHPERAPLGSVTRP